MSLRRIKEWTKRFVEIDKCVTTRQYEALASRIEDLELEKEFPKWNLKRFFDKFKYVRVGNLSSREQKILIHLLQPKCPLPIKIKSKDEYLFSLTCSPCTPLFKDVVVGQVLEIYVKKEEVKNAEHETPVEAGA